MGLARSVDNMNGDGALIFDFLNPSILIHLLICLLLTVPDFIEYRDGASLRSVKGFG